MSGYNSYKQEIKQVVKYWLNKEIIFSDSLSMKIYGKDTLDYSLLKHKYKIINYIDTNGCNECQLKFYEWKQLQKQIDSLHEDIGIIYIVFAKFYTPVKISQKLNQFNVPILYDSLGIMDRKNNFNLYPKYKTFLLDSTNHVIGIGNPIENPQIWELYKTIIHTDQ